MEMVFYVARGREVLDVSYGEETELISLPSAEEKQGFLDALLEMGNVQSGVEKKREACVAVRETKNPSTTFHQEGETVFCVEETQEEDYGDVEIQNVLTDEEEIKRGI